MEDGVPVGALHAHDELVAGDAGVVDQDVDFAELGDDGFDRGFDLLFVGDVESEGGGLAAGGGDFADQFVQFFLIASGYGHGRAVFGEAQGAGASDALRRAGDEGYSS